MKEIDALISKALKYKKNGLTDHEIAEDLNVSKETAIWLLNKGKEKKPEGDIKVGWRSLGVYPSRMSYISDALCDILLEEIENNDLDVNTVVGIAINGIPFATLIAEKLDFELAVFRPHHEKEGWFYGIDGVAPETDPNKVLIAWIKQFFNLTEEDLG